MICRYCKTENPNDAAMCSNCGASMDQGPVEVLDKKRYIAEEASPATKSAARLVSIILIVSVILLAVSGITTMCGAFYKIPFMQMISGLADADLDEIEDSAEELEDSVDELEEWIEEVEDDLSKDELSVANKFVKKVSAMAKTPSLANIKGLVDFAEKNEDDLEDIFGGEYAYSYVDIAGSADEFNNSYNVIFTILLIFGGIVLLMTVLGGLSKNSGLVVAGLILGIPYGLLFGGVVLTILTFLAQLLLAIQCGKINKAYKKYLADNAV